MARVRSVIDEIAPDDSKERIESKGIDVINGRAGFINAHAVKCNEKIITGKYIVIASGSQPLVPQIPGLKDVPYLTNKNIFNIEALPKHLIVLGGGPIGLELSQGFRYLGSEVTVIDMLPHLFPKDDPEVAPVMEEQLQKDGVNLKLSSKILEVKGTAGDITVIIEKDGKKEEVNGDALLVALGRVPETSGLDLINAGVLTDKRGYVLVNEKLQTNIKHIYACGDITGQYQFTHTADHQARMVVRNIIFPFSGKADYSQVPWVTFTKPEVAHCGYTEPQARSLGLFGYSVIEGFKDTDRARTEKDEAGFLKLVIGKNNRIIGVSLVGENAGEMLSLGTLAIKKKMKPSELSGIIFSYPTRSEVYKFAASQVLKDSFKPWMRMFVKNFFVK
jgi:pyruvate/2-oxoglutarate dehydrogenase complex dihydrolipoamide dehydrogenase (E3) component